METPPFNNGLRAFYNFGIQKWWVPGLGGYRGLGYICGAGVHGFPQACKTIWPRYQVLKVNLVGGRPPLFLSLWLGGLGREFKGFVKAFSIGLLFGYSILVFRIIQKKHIKRHSGTWGAPFLNSLFNVIFNINYSNIFEMASPPLLGVSLLP